MSEIRAESIFLVFVVIACWAVGLLLGDALVGLIVGMLVALMIYMNPPKNTGGISHGW